MKVNSDSNSSNAPKLAPKISCGQANGQKFSDLMSKIVAQMGELQAPTKVAPVAPKSVEVSKPASEQEVVSDQVTAPPVEEISQSVNQNALDRATTAEVQRQQPQQAASVPQASTQQSDESSEQQEFEEEVSAGSSGEQEQSVQVEEQSTGTDAEGVEIQAAAKNLENPQEMADSADLELDAEALNKQLELAKNKDAAPSDVSVEAKQVVQVPAEVADVTEANLSEVNATPAPVAPEQIAQTTPVEEPIAQVSDQRLIKQVETKTENSDAGLVESEVKKSEGTGDTAGAETELQKSIEVDALQFAKIEGAIQAQKIANTKADNSSNIVERYLQQVLAPVESAAEVLRSSALRDVLSGQKGGAIERLNGGSIVTSVGTSTTNNTVSSFAPMGTPPQARAAGDREKAARPLPKAFELRTMEKVENALKEVARSRDGKTISVRLDPPSLGSLKLDVTLKDGTLHARITVEHAQVATLLRDRAFDLHALLRRAGFNAERVTLTVSEGQRFEDLAGGDMTGSNAESKGSGAEGRESEAGGEFGTPNQQGRAKRNEVLDHWIA